MEFWIFHQQIVELKFKCKILLEFAENNARLTCSVQELYAIKSNDSKMFLECLSDCVKDEETQCVWQVLFAGCAYTKKINPDLACHLGDFNGIILSLVKKVGLLVLSDLFVHWP